MLYLFYLYSKTFVRKGTKLSAVVVSFLSTLQWVTVGDWWSDSPLPCPISLPNDPFSKSGNCQTLSGDGGVSCWGLQSPSSLGLPRWPALRRTHTAPYMSCHLSCLEAAKGWEGLVPFSAPTCISTAWWLLEQAHCCLSEGAGNCSVHGLLAATFHFRRSPFFSSLRRPDTTP